MDNEGDRQAQEDEMEILTEILDGDCFTKYLGTPISGQMKIKVRMPWATLKCKYTKEVENIESTTTFEDETGNSTPSSMAGPSKRKISSYNILNLKHMPPLTLHFTLSPDYPSTSKPNFTLSSNWLYRDSLSFFCSKLDQLWEENKGMAILYTWHSFLQEDAFAALGMSTDTVYDLTFFCEQNGHGHGRPSGYETPVKDIAAKTEKRRKVMKSESCDDDLTPTSSRCKVKETSPSSQRTRVNSIRSSLGSVDRFDQRAVFERIPDSFIQYLINYEKEEIEKEFCRASHSCTICLSEKRGNDCILFECEHIFCRECLREFFKLHITEGSLDCVKCPDVDCKTVPTPYEVKTIVGPEMFERYDTLLLSKTLDSMSDILNCPRINCNRPVMYDPAEKLAKCASCGYAFCSFCKMVYHGVEPCRFRSGEAKILYDKYSTGTVDERKQLEKTYGKKQLELLVQQTLSEEWVTSQSKPCPHCKVPIDKFEGCNKVTCFKCATYFCWICATQLDKENPYFHFNDPSSPCYNNLFANLDANEPNDDDDWQVPADGREHGLELEDEDPPQEDEESEEDSILSELEFVQLQGDVPPIKSDPEIQLRDTRNRSTAGFLSGSRVKVRMWMGFMPELEYAHSDVDYDSDYRECVNELNSKEVDSDSDHP